MCVQLAPVLQNPLSHQQEPAATEPGLHKDDLESILGDVSEARLHQREHTPAKPLARHKMAAMLFTQAANLCECLCLEAGSQRGNVDEKPHFWTNICLFQSSLPLTASCSGLSTACRGHFQTARDATRDRWSAPRSRAREPETHKQDIKNDSISREATTCSLSVCLGWQFMF